MHPAVSAAIARFPDRELAIQKLAEADDDFRTLCIDLADAQAALEEWKKAVSPDKEARCAELQDLVRDLVAELTATLDGRL